MPFPLVMSFTQKQQQEDDKYHAESLQAFLVQLIAVTLDDDFLHLIAFRLVVKTTIPKLTMSRKCLTQVQQWAGWIDT